MNMRTLYPNGATTILMLVYGVLFATCALVIFANVLFGTRRWDALKLLSWADNVIDLTRDTLVGATA